jgi:hypothetical protein
MPERCKRARGAIERVARRGLGGMSWTETRRSRQEPTLRKPGEEWGTRKINCLRPRLAHPARIHKTLRVTPAMEAGLADHVWTVGKLWGYGIRRKRMPRSLL